ncbi:MAG: methyltransferase [Pseudomonadota bacterium]|nr:methyltransferase [Pseudomonadota bacterium]
MDDSAAAPALIRRPSLRACLAAIRAPELYRNFAIHLFVMFPAAMVMCFLGVAVDVELGLAPLGPWPAVAVLGALLIGLGGVWVWYVYGYLFLAGGGSPGTHVDGGPTTMVDTGPYTLVRHPSVLGKLLGVVGLGLIWQSPVFLVGFVPVLVAYSVLTNRYLQERFCDARFGARYAAYRARVPMLVPRPDGLRRWWADEAAVPGDFVLERNPQPEGIWLEFRGYLIGLALLIGLFAGVWGVVHAVG